MAYVPEELGTTLPRLSAQARDSAEDAVTVLARADERIGSRGAYLNHLLIRSESISSSWIEGNRITPKRLAIAEALHQGTRVALDVIGNVRATEDAIAALADLIPISTVFAGDTAAYIAGLTAFRGDLPQLDEWVIGFARATELAAANAVSLADDVVALDAKTLDDLIAYRRTHGLAPAVPRRDAVVLRILETLATDPVLTVDAVAERHGVSVTAAHRALTAAGRKPKAGPPQPDAEHLGQLRAQG